MRVAFSAATFAVLLLTGCNTDKPETRDSNVIKIKVTAKGDIVVDGKPIGFEELATRLVTLKKAGGKVWYHREDPSGEPHPNAMKVIELVAENKLPVRLSAKPDFSDAVDDKGISRPGAK